MNPCYIQSLPCALRASGADAFSFLQSQFSNDLRNSTSTSPVYGLWLNQKGRIQADSFIFRDSEESLRIYSRYTDGSFLKSFLEERLIADEVELDQQSAPAVLISRWPTSDDVHSPWFADPTLPAGGVSRLVAKSETETVCQEESLSSISTDVLEKELLLNGIPRIPTDLAVDVFPQEINRDALVSYNKGCFLGQEVMARLRYQGKLRKGLQLFHSQKISTPPAPGSSLMEDNRKAGVILRIESYPEEHYILALCPLQAFTTVTDSHQQQWTPWPH